MRQLRDLPDVLTMLRSFNPARAAQRRDAAAQARREKQAQARRVLATSRGRAATMGPAATAPAPKDPPGKNRTLLDMARGRPCLIQSPICVGGTDTTVACHGAGIANGKGMGWKVSDALTCWGCWRCNDYTDAYKNATAAEKLAAFQLGHYHQVLAWRRIATSADEPERFRRAARWALEYLNATPIVDLENAP